MEFTLICPNDGRVEMSLENISALVFREPESVEIVFLCPHCGTSLRAAVRVPNLLLAAMELAQSVGEADEDALTEVQRRLSDDTDAREESGESEMRDRLEREGEPYLEYFRRQLADVECVEDFLAQFE